MKRDGSIGWGIKITIILLALLVVLAIGYISWSEYSDWKQEEDFGKLQQGAQIGYEQAIAQLFQGAASCQQVPVTYNNQTINVIAIECLQAAQQQTQQPTV